MSCFSLPGITRIQIIRCSALDAGLMHHSICGCDVVINASAVDVEFSGIPTLKWEGTMVNGTRQEKSTLEFNTIHLLPEGENLAFLVTAASDRRVLIGTKESRFPIIEYSDSTGSVTGSAAVRSYKITHVAQKSVLQCAPL